MQQTFLIAGLACVIGAIVGGGLKAFGIELPLVNSRIRQAVLGLLGVMLIAAGTTPYVRFPQKAETTNDRAPTASGTAQPSRRKSQVCVVRLAVPADNAVLPLRRLDNGKLESDWMFGWHDCPEASRYHLYVIGPHALNPIIDTDTLTAATYRFRRSSHGVTQREGWTWKVRAFIDGRWGDWSEERRFNIAGPDELS